VETWLTPRQEVTAEGVHYELVTTASVMRGASGCDTGATRRDRPSDPTARHGSSRFAPRSATPPTESIERSAR